MPLSNQFLLFTSYRRIPTKPVAVGEIVIGGDAPIRIQTMTNTATSDVLATLKQVKLLYENGAELVRIAVPSISDVESLRKIADSLKKRAYKCPYYCRCPFQSRNCRACGSFCLKSTYQSG